MPDPKDVTEPIQLLVEGRDAQEFFGALISAVSAVGVQVQNFGGIDELRGFLKALRNTPGFASHVRSLGIVRDAERDAHAAFASVCGALRLAGLGVPAAPGAVVIGPPHVCAFILQNNSSPGMLETMCLRSVSGDPAMQCINQFLECVQTQLNTALLNIDKARLQAFLASRQRPGLLLGQAARANHWPWESPAFDLAKRFLQTL